MNNVKISKLWIIMAVVSLTLMSCALPTTISQLINSSPTATAEPVIEATEVAPTATENADSTADVSTATYLIPDEVLQQDALISLYDNVNPGIVSIQVVTADGAALGSGFVVDKAGHIVTNYHVVEDATSVEVDFVSGLKVYANVIGVDLDSDLAVIQVDAPEDELFPLTIGDSSQVRVGQTVVAIGNPYGLSGTMTVGIVSALGRTLDSIRQTTEGSYFSAADLIQTDATINPGNSGGPLLNLNGEVIGINRAIQVAGTTFSGDSVNTGIGFAISSNILSLVLPSLINGETYAYPYLGVSAYPSLTLSEADYLGLSEATGAYVLEVVPGGPADQAGLQAGNQLTQVQGLYGGGDLIVAVDGQEIVQFSELLNYMMLNKHPGDEMVLTVLRGDQTLDLTVTLGERQ
ncbi:MAG: trypsin-like peptidase domain-containing protein [Anaerolineaceae bacterium]|nr:trypsin-like peptidase domain-containing protein [Anaerolineaceae bacterium]